jgi:hypothetical protein
MAPFFQLIFDKDATSATAILEKFGDIRIRFDVAKEGQCSVFIKPYNDNKMKWTVPSIAQNLEFVANMPVQPMLSAEAKVALLSFSSIFTIPEVCLLVST